MNIDILIHRTDTLLPPPPYFSGENPRTAMSLSILMLYVAMVTRMLDGMILEYLSFRNFNIFLKGTS